MFEKCQLFTEDIILFLMRNIVLSLQQLICNLVCARQLLINSSSLYNINLVSGGYTVTPLFATSLCASHLSILFCIFPPPPPSYFIMVNVGRDGKCLRNVKEEILQKKLYFKYGKIPLLSRKGIIILFNSCFRDLKQYLIKPFF